jgi:hypothetical protein
MAPFLLEMCWPASAVSAFARGQTQELLFGYFLVVLHVQSEALIILVYEVTPCRELSYFPQFFYFQGDRRQKEQFTVVMPCRFGEGLELVEQQWLTQEVNSHLEGLQGFAVDTDSMPSPDAPAVYNDSEVS